MPYSAGTGAARNIFLLAADASPQLLPLLRTDPALATAQDSTGYSLLHALVSYRHLDLLRTIVREFSVRLDLRDEDGETALFVAEHVDAVKCLVEDLGGGADFVSVRNSAGQTAEEKMRAEIEEGYAEDSVQGVVDYLAKFTQTGSVAALQKREENGGSSDSAASHSIAGPTYPPSLPKGVTLNVGTMAEDEAPAEVNQDFRHRIEQLAARDDFTAAEGQQELKDLVRDTVSDIDSEGRDVRRRTD